MRGFSTSNHSLQNGTRIEIVCGNPIIGTLAFEAPNSTKRSRFTCTTIRFGPGWSPKQRIGGIKASCTICVGNEGFAVSMRERIKRESEAPAEPRRAIVRPSHGDGMRCLRRFGRSLTLPWIRPRGEFSEVECVAANDHATLWNRSACTARLTKKFPVAITYSMHCLA